MMIVAARSYRLLSVEDVEAGLERLGSTIRRRGDIREARCPAHDDRRPSLSFGPSRRDDGSAFLHCHAGCRTADVVRALNVAGTAAPLSPEEIERRRAEEEAERSARTARARARWEAAVAHPNRQRALEHFAPTLRWDVQDLLRRGVGWDGERVVFPIVGDAGALVGCERYAPPSSRAREFGPKLIAHGPRGLWPRPVRVPGLRFLVEGAPCAATMLGCGLPTVAFPGAAGVHRIYAERLRDAGAQDLIVLADADAVGRTAAKTSVLVLRDVGIQARAIDLFVGADDGRDVADELRARDDGIAWLLGELGELGITPTTKEVHA
jgi:hypothetical protein